MASVAVRLGEAVHGQGSDDDQDQPDSECRARERAYEGPTGRLEVTHEPIEPGAAQLFGLLAALMRKSRGRLT